MKTRKIIIISICILIMLIFLNANICYATDLGIGDLNNYKTDNIQMGNLASRAGTVLGIVQTIGSVLAVAMLVIIGIKYMLGSIEEKAEYKKTLIPYLIGAFLVFTGTLIPNIIYKIVQGW